jgi:hypothetical protein
VEVGRVGITVVGNKVFVLGPFEIVETLNNITGPLSDRVSRYGLIAWGMGVQAAGIALTLLTGVAGGDGAAGGRHGDGLPDADHGGGRRKRAGVAGAGRVPLLAGRRAEALERALAVRCELEAARWAYRQAEAGFRSLGHAYDLALVLSSLAQLPGEQAHAAEARRLLAALRSG